MRTHTMLVRNYYENKGSFAGIKEQPWFEYVTDWEEKCYRDIGMATASEMSCFSENKLSKKYKDICTYKGVTQDDRGVLDLLTRYFTSCIDTFIRYTDGPETVLANISDAIRTISTFPVKEVDKFIDFYLSTEFKIKHSKLNNVGIRNGRCYVDKDYTQEEWDHIVRAALEFTFDLYRLLPKKYRQSTATLAYLSIENMSTYKTLLEFATKTFGSYKKFLNILGVNLPDESASYSAYGILIYNLVDSYIVIGDQITGGIAHVESLSDLHYYVPKDKLHNIDKLTGGL